MLLCENCFRDEVCRESVRRNGVRQEFPQGACPVCGQSNPEYSYDTSKIDSLNAGFEDLLRIYTPESSLPGFEGQLPGLAEEVQKRWRIFNGNIPNSTVVEILKELAPALAADEKAKKIFSEPVGIKDIIENNQENLTSIFSIGDWNSFVQRIKTECRYHLRCFNFPVLERYLSYLVTTYETGSAFFRARLAHGEKGFDITEMGAPPASACIADGRINARGIRCLYLANTAKTTLHEIRAGGFDKVCIGTFCPKRRISVINLRKINYISPFTSGIDDIQSLALNKGYFEQLGEYMSRRSSRAAGSLDYIPTQYIADFIKNGITSDHYDGVEYKSTMNDTEDCYNLAIFEPELFDCRSVALFEARVEYKLNPVRTVARIEP